MAGKRSKRVKKANPNRRKVGPLDVHGPPCALDPRWATLLVGEAPNRWMSQDPTRARHVLFRRDLAELCGLVLPDYYRCFARTNLLDYYPGRSGKGSAFPATDARRQAAEALEHLDGFRRVVLLGKRVGRAFLGRRQGGVNWYEWTSDGGPPMAVVPHPSRVSRYWNDHANVQRATRFWAELATGILSQVRAEKVARSARGEAPL